MIEHWYVGSVTKESFARGTKSCREAVKLVTQDERFVLRRINANSYCDPELEALVGKTIRCKGFVKDYSLFMTQWEVQPPAKRDA